MSKFRILTSPKHHLLRLYRASTLWRQGFNRDNQMNISSQVKSALRKLRDWEKTRIVTVYYSCHMYLYCTSLVLHIWLNRPLYLLNLNALSRFLRLQTTEWENVEACETVGTICLRGTFHWWSSTFLPTPKLVSVRAKRASTKCGLLQNDGTWKMGKIFCNLHLRWMPSSLNASANW